MATPLEEELLSSYLSGGSMAYVDALYEDFLADPMSVSEDWRKQFSSFPPSANAEIAHRAIRLQFVDDGEPKTRIASLCDAEAEAKQSYVTDWINAWRTHGHLLAHLDPLKLYQPPFVPALTLQAHHLSDADLDTVFYVGDTFSAPYLTLRILSSELQKSYAGSIGIEYMHIARDSEIQWFRKMMESQQAVPLSSEEKMALLEDLVAADGLERYLGTRYVGQKRFSLEGGDALIPLMKEMVRLSGAAQVDEVVIGMAHRGRLNVLVNVLGKAPHVLFDEFEGKVNHARTGDVKYHMGFSSDVKTFDGNIVHLALAFNPSHLEIISPVVEGSCRVRLEKRNDLAKKDKILPVVIHGDAAMAGQGVVMETFNLSQTRGYSTGGTVHIVVNNQVGFTTSAPQDARSTYYCTDVAKMVDAPVIHVNGDDPEAVIFSIRMAFQFRMLFKRDVVIDLVCYRRHGHNEADEPLLTQPLMYQHIKKKRPLKEDYANQLIAEGLLSKEELASRIEAYRQCLERGESVVSVVAHENNPYATDWTPYLDTKWTEVRKTAITKDSLVLLQAKLQTLPKGFKLHPVVQKLLLEREKMSAGEIPINWGYGEAMAFASLVQDGFGVRLSGQDSGRGTFAHRHAVLHDMATGEVYVPLDSLSDDPARKFTVIDSVLSEEAVLAFEYGYAASSPTSLVLWEAQFGDFANGAQVVIDQFISSGEQKWGRLCGLVMLLPHGYEGQGPEHSSARLERYLQLCAEHNMQVCVPTTPSQVFHMLRRQMLRPFRKPLVVMTPKSLLRHKLAVSSLSDLITGAFQTVITEVDDILPKAVKKVILCTGKVYYDLLEKRREEKKAHVAILRIEQLYPFPKEDLIRALQVYSDAHEIVWCQEEPQNQGSWFALQDDLRACLKVSQTLHYCGRLSSAAPAVGNFALHEVQQKALVEKALQ